MAPKTKVVKGDFVQSLGKAANKLHEAYEDLDEKDKEHLPKRMVVEAVAGISNIQSFAGRHVFEIVLGLGTGLALYSLRKALEVDAEDLLND